MEHGLSVKEVKELFRRTTNWRERVFFIQWLLFPSPRYLCWVDGIRDSPAGAFSLPLPSNSASRLVYLVAVAGFYSTLRCADLSRVEVAPVAQMAEVTVWSIISRRLHEKITSVQPITLGYSPLCVFAWSPLSTRLTRLEETVSLCSNCPMS